MTGLAEAVEEMKLIKEGKMQARNAEDFLDEHFSRCQKQVPDGLACFFAD